MNFTRQAVCAHMHTQHGFARFTQAFARRRISGGGVVEIGRVARGLYHRWARRARWARRPSRRGWRCRRSWWSIQRAHGRIRRWRGICNSYGHFHRLRRGRRGLRLRRLWFGRLRLGRRGHRWRWDGRRRCRRGGSRLLRLHKNGHHHRRLHFWLRLNTHEVRSCVQRAQMRRSHAQGHSRQGQEVSTRVKRFLIRMHKKNTPLSIASHLSIVIKVKSSKLAPCAQGVCAEKTKG